MSCAARAYAADDIEIARRIAQAGALDLALARIEQHQPTDASVPRWVDWESLRLDLLSRKGRDAEILQRVAALRERALPAAAAGSIYAHAARSALRLHRAAEARGFLARLLLRADLPAAEHREARLAVIDSLLAERAAADAYQAMLRFQQDFSPLRREEAERFAAGLLAQERAAEAAGWLAQLDPGSPTAALLRLRAGLIKPEQAIAQARAMLARTASESALTLLLAAGLAQKNRTIEIEVAEARLQAGVPEESAGHAERSAALWKLYSDTGEGAANDLQLLSGDDAAWIERAGRIQSSQPQLARALLATVASAGRTRELRAVAELQLIASLRDGRLGLVALRLFGAPQRHAVERIDPRVRLQLGALAAEHRLPSEAVLYWRNLAAPPGVSTDEWQLRNVAVLVQAGLIDAALGASRTLLGARSVVPAEVLQRMTAIAAQALDAWQARFAGEVLEMLLPISKGADRIAALQGLARARELTGEHRAAAGAYIEIAVVSAAPDADRQALRAREAAAVNLARAGMLEDARAVWQWLAQHAKDAAVRENASRALKPR